MVHQFYDPNDFDTLNALHKRVKLESYQLPKAKTPPTKRLPKAERVWLRLVNWRGYGRARILAERHSLMA